MKQISKFKLPAGESLEISKIPEVDKYNNHNFSVVPLDPACKVALEYEPNPELKHREPIHVRITKEYIVNNLLVQQMSELAEGLDIPLITDCKIVNLGDVDVEIKVYAWRT